MAFNLMPMMMMIALHIGTRSALYTQRNKCSSVEHAVMSATLSPNTSSSLDNKNLNIVPYKLNLFTNLDNANENLLTNKSVQRCRALSIMTRDEMLSGADLRGRSER